ncbi:MAG TPA: hypothetical protein VJ732_13110, partial [Bryobacteraceae bacterium]|nr:hypothetical protein [Bryobacteraceae bacterium]
LAFTGACPTAGAARQLEETLRALASLGSATRDPNLSALFRSVQVRRDNTTVHAALSLGPDLLDTWLRDLPR